MSGFNMLVVDDEPLVLDYIQTALKRLGHNAITADSGERAIELLEKNEFDLILSDLRLPGVSGIVVLDNAKRIQPDTPVIILTAHGTIENAVAEIYIT